jgi:hypothetical protein
MKQISDENVPDPSTRGHFFEPRNDPRNAGKFCSVIPAPIPGTGGIFIFRTPQTGPRIYIIPIPGKAFYYYYLHRGLR